GRQERLPGRQDRRGASHDRSDHRDRLISARGAPIYSRSMRDSAERFFNRELSWLDFDRRVLDLARDAGRPILERAKFLAIFSRNLDEFFQVRVSELQDLVAERDDAPSPDGLSPAARLAALRER